MIPLNSIRNVVLHEVGHSFGLGHYIMTLDGKKSGDIYQYSAMVPSLDPWDEDLVLEIQPSDISMMTELYGTDGWLGEQTFPLPAMCTFVNGIQTMEADCD